jgi:FtsP/CotA-like multicopper oxidase with cupredoxin domain
VVTTVASPDEIEEVIASSTYLWTLGKRLFYQAVSSASTIPNTTNGSFASAVPPNCENTNSTTAPVIRMSHGNHYILVLINRSSEPTNLHTHGLHISGVGAVDDITRTVSTDHCLVYHYDLVDDADVGTFWYHSHRHPIASHQVEKGAYGLLIVDETPEILFNHYPPHLQAFLRNEVLLQYASVLNKTTNIRTNVLNGVEQSLPWPMHNNTSKDKNHSSNNMTLPPLLNLRFHRDEWYYLRISFVILSDPTNFVEVYPPSACEVRIVAYDGVYRSQVPSNFTLYRHMMTVSSRVDLAVRCSAETAELHFHQGGGGGTSTGLTNASRLVLIHAYKGADEASTQPIRERPSPYWDPHRKTLWKPRRPYYMEDLLIEKEEASIESSSPIPMDIWNVSMNDILMKNGSKKLYINDKQWDPSMPIRSVQLGRLVEWNLRLTQEHPFHIHINRMQIAEPGGCGYRYEHGEYYDTIAALNESCRVRLHFQDFAGRVVAHCHKQKHEDRGMMVWFNVTDGPGAGVLAAHEQQCLSS